MLKVKVHAASIMDRDGIRPLLKRTKDLFSRAFLTFGWTCGVQRTGQRQGLGREDPGPDGGGRAPLAQAPLRVGQRGEESDWGKLRELLPPPGFRILPRRWVVDRTFSWIEQNRRMSKDYEKLAETGEAVGSLMRPFRRFLRSRCSQCGM